MHQTLTKTLLVLVALFAIILISCEGPEGPEGPQGPAGADGKSAAIDCMDCHNSSTMLKAKMMQYEESLHYMGDAYVRSTSASCAGCHSHEGFRVWAKDGYDKVAGVPEPTPVACRTCHDVHSKYTLEDYALVGTAKFNQFGDFTDGAEYDKGKSNMCAKCHQSRTRNYGLVHGSTEEYTISDSRFGPHHGPQSNVIMGNGAFRAGNAADWTDTKHTHGTSQALADGCVSCHANTGNHTFEATISSCDGCHSGIKSFDLGGFQTEVAAKLQELEDKLVAEGLLTVAVPGEMGSPKSGVKTTQSKAGALFNYFVIYEDGSKGVHNPKFVTKLLDNSLAVFN